MKHAFIICAHKGCKQMEILISQLSFADIFIHIDSKAEELFFQLSEIYKSQNNVFLINDRVDVNWSGFSQVQATLNLLNATKQTGRLYDYIHYISGQDLLLVNHKKMDKMLMEYDDKSEFINYDSIGAYRWRLKNYSLFRENKKNRKFVYRIADNLMRIVQCPFRRKNLQGLELYKGSSWFSITQECADFVLSKGMNQEYIKQFSYTACPDEHFFQILILNSPFKDKVVNNNLRFVEFHNLNASPTTLTKKDMPKFMTDTYILARKFDLNVDKSVVEEVILQAEAVNISSIGE